MTAQTAICADRTSNGAPNWIGSTPAGQNAAVSKWGGQVGRGRAKATPGRARPARTNGAAREAFTILNDLPSERLA